MTNYWIAELDPLIVDWGWSEYGFYVEVLGVGYFYLTTIGNVDFASSNQIALVSASSKAQHFLTANFVLDTASGDIVFTASGGTAGSINFHSKERIGGSQQGPILIPETSDYGYLNMYWPEEVVLVEPGGAGAADDSASKIWNYALWEMFVVSQMHSETSGEISHSHFLWEMIHKEIDAGNLKGINSNINQDLFLHFAQIFTSVLEEDGHRLANWKVTYGLSESQLGSSYINTAQAMVANSNPTYYDADSWKSIIRTYNDSEPTQGSNWVATYKKVNGDKDGYISNT